MRFHAALFAPEQHAFWAKYTSWSSLSAGQVVRHQPGALLRVGVAALRYTGLRSKASSHRKEM